ncbi:hypothetical protein BV22DRAFT_458873 [Leucogyrophana mollusca]|uniref:Uncharacterized protein n=1 Tax=Leucogyrophana mollusca TaxID=85980 RepID=A0ACB8BGZ5_9AGAM|nr:hypothetical protein BV22DRAFT_458873 [Leucogyrophana mollusca]
MPLELIKEEWTPRSVTSIFSPPSSDQLKNIPVVTERCGLGWRFSFTGAANDKTGKCHYLYIRPYCDISSYRRAAVTVVAAFQPSATYDNPSLEAVTLGGFTLHAFDPLKPVKSQRLPGTWTRAQLCGQKFVSFTVSFDTQPPVENLLTLLRRMTLGDSVVRKVTPVTIDGSDRPAARVALARSLNTGESFDTKFIAFSRRKNEQNLSGPHVIYADSAVLKAISTDLVLGPSERTEHLLSDLSCHQCLDIIETYDYESDSDLGDDEGADDEAVDAELLDSNRTGAEDVTEESDSLPPRTSTLAPNVLEVTIEENTRPPNDVISVSSISDFEDVGSEVHVCNGQVEDEGPVQQVKPSVMRTILVKGAAYRTWRAVVYYCYTGQVVFAPLKSRNVESALPPGCEGAISCSPKSVYRLADALGIDALKDAALAAILGDLSPKNILDEAFSRFTSKYPAVQDMEVAHLVRHRTTSEVVQAFPTKIQKISLGEMPHAEKVLSNIMQRLLQT